MGSQTFRTSPTCLTCLTRPSPNTDSCSFAPFVLLRGLKISIEFSLFPSHEALQSMHERERANNSAFLRADTIRLSADSLIASADRIRKPADTIRKQTGWIRPQTSRKMKKSAVFEVKNYKNRKISPKNLLQNPPPKKNFGRFPLFVR